jgi:signal transduction histidine kinase
MLTRPRHIWAAYLLILSLLAAGFAWLSLRVVELDERERLSSAHADQEERIRLALWRMESVAMPIVAAEAARPYFTYEPYTQPVGGDASTRIPSPLLRQPSEYVLLNFQIDAAGRMESPQCPPAGEWEWACSSGTTNLLNIQLSCPRLEELQSDLPADRLLAQLPADAAPMAVWSAPGAVPPAAPGLAPDAAYVQNSNTLAAAGPSQVQEPAQKEYANRASKLQILAQRSAVEQRQVLDAALPRTPVREGISRPLWISDRLLLARRVEIGGESFIQGCWLDWDRLRTELLSELEDVLPGATLKVVPAAAAAAPGRSLASLPVQLVAPNVILNPRDWTPTRIALVVAWAGLVVAGVALAGLLHGVASLSERRAAFVSAVTHELRTPLTTLQLYTDMLTADMVHGEPQRQEYIETLHREAGRLSHLVENVLALSRLERKSSRCAAETLSTGALLERATPRLRARTDQSQRSLEVSVSDDARDALVCVEPTVIEQILLNLVDNGCKHTAGAADGRLTLAASRADGHVEVRLRDAGPGISPQALRKLFRRFSKSDVEAARTTPGLGLGLALSRDLARGEGGDLLLERSGVGGTTFLLRLPVAK